jgi:hypothetical protein
VRARLFAPARVLIHDDARAGDWLERSSVRRNVTFRERTVIAQKRGDLWIVDKTGPGWATRALRLVCDRDGKVLAAAAGTPGKDDLVAIKIGPEARESDAGTVEVETPAGKVKARRTTFQLGGSLPEETTRTVGLEGPFRGIELASETVRAGHKRTVTLADVSEATLAVGGVERACWKLTRRTAQDGAILAVVVEWVSKAPLFFGERVLLRREEGGPEEKTDLGRDSPPVFPLSAPR